jgi:hypothetical protein
LLVKGPQLRRCKRSTNRERGSSESLRIIKTISTLDFRSFEGSRSSGVLVAVSRIKGEARSWRYERTINQERDSSKSPEIIKIMSIFDFMIL